MSEFYERILHSSCPGYQVDQRKLALLSVWDDVVNYKIELFILDTFKVFFVTLFYKDLDMTQAFKQLNLFRALSTSTCC